MGKRARYPKPDDPADEGDELLEDDRSDEEEEALRETAIVRAEAAAGKLLDLPEEFDPRVPLKRNRWEHFAQYVALQGLFPDAAYRAVGGTGKNAREQGLKLQRKPQVRARITYLQDLRAEKQLEVVTYERDDVLRILFRNINEARSGVVVHQGEIVRDELGQPIRKVDHKAVNTAAELLGREIGMFPKESKLKVQHEGELEGMTLAEQLSYLKTTLWEASDGAVDLDTQALLELLAPAAGGQGPAVAGSEPDPALPAVPEAVPVPRDGGVQERAAPAGGEPAGEDDVWDG